MAEADYYPPGAYSDPNAPYNQKEPELEEVEVKGDVSISLSHTDVPIKVEAVKVTEKDYDEGGSFINVYHDFTDSKPEEAYEKSPLYIIQLLHEYADVLRGYRDVALSRVSSTKTYLRLLDNSEYFTEDKKKEKYKVANRELKTRQKIFDDLTHKIEACEGWYVDDINVCI